jgi:hypothetical protein
MFLDDNTYNENYSEKALEHVSMFFRSESKWKINENLYEFGKFFFFIEKKNKQTIF